MKESCQGSDRNYREQTEDIVLHFVDGNLQLDERTNVASSVLSYKATLYSDEYIGKPEGSDAMIVYNENQEVWVAVKNSDEGSFTWSNWETERKVTVLFYVLTYDSEYLLYCSNKDFFCYLTIPKEDPRKDRIRRIPNTHFNTTYQVLDELLKQANKYSFKCIPKRFEG